MEYPLEVFLNHVRIDLGGKMKTQNAFFAIGCLLISAGPTYAQTTNLFSGSKLLGACKNAALDKPSSAGSMGFLTGLCMGSINAVFFFRANESFCPPDGSDVNQGILVTVRYLDNNPQFLHLPLAELADRAFMQAWPCKR